jgi:hypothetical protein
MIGWRQGVPRWGAGVLAGFAGIRRHGCVGPKVVIQVIVKHFGAGLRPLSKNLRGL